MSTPPCPYPSFWPARYESFLSLALLQKKDFFTISKPTVHPSMITPILSFPFMFLSPHVGYTPKTEALSYLSLCVRAWYCASDPSEDSAVCCKWINEVTRPVPGPEDHPFLWPLLPTTRTGALNSGQTGRMNRPKMPGICREGWSLPASRNPWDAGLSAQLAVWRRVSEWGWPWFLANKIFPKRAGSVGNLKSHLQFCFSCLPG